MNQSISQVNQLPTTTVDVTRWFRQLDNKINQSFKDVELSVAYSRTKGKDLTKFVDSFTSTVNTDNEWVTTWFDI